MRKLSTFTIIIACLFITYYFAVFQPKFQIQKIHAEEGDVIFVNLRGSITGAGMRSFREAFAKEFPNNKTIVVGGLEAVDMIALQIKKEGK